jgi:putative transcriptional regulator
LKYSLKELRARKNLTQEQTAKELDISTQTYNSWEQDFGKVKTRDANRVANFFGVTMDDILFIEKLENKSSEKRR